jgi:hypothetical protein
MRRSFLPAAVGIVLVAGLVLIENIDQPLVRNSITYAQTAQAIVDSGFNPLAVNVQSSKLYGRPISFPLISSPLVQWMGANRGLKVASFISMLLFLAVSCLFIARMRRQLRLDPSLDGIDLLILFFNPLVVYLFWAAHPDGLFATTFLLSLLLADQLMQAPRRQGSLALVLAVAIYATIEFKYYGAILIGIIPAYCACLSYGQRARFDMSRSTVVALTVGVGIPCLLLVAGIAGVNPTLNLENVSGLSDYERASGDTGTLALYVLGSCVVFVVFLLTVFSITAAYLLRRPHITRYGAALMAVVVIFIGGLLPFRGTTYNLRYFLPILPIFVLVVTQGLRASTVRIRAIAITIFVLLQGGLVLNYNAQVVHERFAPINRVAEALRYPGTARVMSVLDNLRMGHHIAAQEVIDTINRDVEPGALLYMVSDYYGEAAHGFYEEIGLINRPDIEILYTTTLVRLAQSVRRKLGRSYYVCVRCDEMLQASTAYEVSMYIRRTVRPVGRLLKTERGGAGVPEDVSWLGWRRRARAGSGVSGLAAHRSCH